MSENGGVSLKDLVVRDNFPALHKDGKHLIEGEEPLPRDKFQSFGKALDLDTRDDLKQSLQQDCATVFTARTRDDSEAYSAGNTYFLPCTMKPRCALEALAQAVFDAHTQGLEGAFLREQSGAEWWTLVMNAEPPDLEQDSEEMNDEDEVGLHFDADYGLEDQHSILLHPRLATITYLSEVGAPTLILDRQSPSSQKTIKEQLEGEINKGWISGPTCGKHVAFDGRLLHGAPATFFPGALPKSAEPPKKRLKTDVSSEQQTTTITKTTTPSQRVTFMVNIWLNHCPLDPEPLDDGIVEQMKTPWDHGKGGKSTGEEVALLDISKITESLKTPDTLETKCLEVYEEDPAGSEDTVILSHNITLSYNSQMEKQHLISLQATKEGKSFELDMKKGTMTLEVGGVVEEEEEDE